MYESLEYSSVGLTVRIKSPEIIRNIETNSQPVEIHGRENVAWYIYVKLNYEFRVWIF